MESTESLIIEQLKQGNEEAYRYLYRYHYVSLCHVAKEYVGDDYSGIPIHYIYNPIYDKTNNIYSLSLAKKELQEDDTLLIESDLIFEDSLFRKIIDNPYPNLALIAKYEPWMDGTMVCLNEEGDIVDFISKSFSCMVESHRNFVRF